MDKLVKKEVLTVYFSQFALIAVVLFCCLVPLFSDSLYLTGWKAISGLCILASIFVVNIFYMTTQFQGKKSILPGKISNKFQELGDEEDTSDFESDCTSVSKETGVAVVTINNLLTNPIESMFATVRLRLFNKRKRFQQDYTDNGVQDLQGR